MDKTQGNELNVPIRVHRTGSVSINDARYSLPLPATAAATPSKSMTPDELNASSPSPRNNWKNTVGPVTSPYLSPGYRSSRLASSVLGQTSFSSNIHNSRAVLSALRALQDKIRNLETERSSFSERCTSLQTELTTAKEKLNSDEDAEKQQARRLEETTHEFSKQKNLFDIETARQEEKLNALHTELVMVKEQAQRSASERRSAIDRVARTEVEAKAAEDALLKLRSELAVETAGRRSAEQRVSELQQLVNRLMTTNEELMSKKKGKRRKKKKKTSTTRTQFGSTGSRTTSMSRARQQQADRDRAAAVTRRQHKHGLSLKEQVRLANLGKDPPFMPSGNPKVDNNVYSITQKQLANPMAYGNTASRFSKPHAKPMTSSNQSNQSNQFNQSNQSNQYSSPPTASSSYPSETKTTTYTSPPPAAPSSTPASRVPYQSNESSSPTSPQQQDTGLGAVIDAIRHELAALTTRRDSLLKNAADSLDGHLNLDQRTIDLALSDLQQKIDSKSRQLVLLRQQEEAQQKNFSRAQNSPPPVYVEARRKYSPRSPLRDTEASEKKQAALDLLRHYKATSAENEHDHLMYNELHGRSMAAGGVPTKATNDEGAYDVLHRTTTTSARRGTYFGTYDLDEAKRLQERERGHAK